ncbi:MAG: hypothetical protein B6241_05400 [Spirochaetaceae bacterium 4572_59]|nr:MAG: hypothetical protein B6241_05400 [Spirochaetaceae bacterium 4572_59]
MPVSEFRKTIKGRLLIYTGFSTLMIMLIIAVFYSFTREHLIKDVEKEIMNGVKLFALNIENANRESIKVAETIAHVQEHGFLGKRTQSTAFIRTILQNHPQFTGIYLGYEANADQNDAAYLANNPSEQKAMDKNGRYLPYWFIKNSKIELTALVDMETSLYYQGTKEKYHSNAKDKSNITEPYFYEGKMIVEYTYPISIGNEFLGVAGVDRALTDMLYLLSSFKPYKSSNFVLISAKGRIISSNMDLGTTETVQSVLKKQEKDINARQVDNKMLTFHLDETNFAPLLDHFYQMEIDSTETEIYRDQENRIFHYAATKIKTGNWTLVMGVAEDEVYGPIYDLLWEILAILFVILMLLIFMAIKLSKKISQPVTDLIVAASNLAKGNFDIHLPDFSITEINNLKKTLVDTAIELKKLTSNLEAEKERLFVTFRSIGDAVITTDTSGRLTLMNRIAEQLTGWKNNEAQGRPLDEVFPIINELTRLKIESPVAEVLKTGKIVGLAKYTVLISRDGTEYQLADSAAAIRDSQNNITGAVLVFRDVTGESLMQKELIESEKRYRFLAEQPGQMIYDYNLLNGNIDWSGDIEGVTGFTADEFQNVNIESWGKMIHPDDQKNALELLGTGMKEKGHYDPTYRFKCKDGSFKFIEESGYFLANKNEKPHQMLGIMKDISTRIQSEKDLQESEEKFRTIFENAPILIDSFDQSGRCTLWNKECENVYGWTIEELNSADDALSLIYPNPDRQPQNLGKR